MDSESLLRRSTVIMGLGEANPGFTDCESPNILDECFDAEYKPIALRSYVHEKLLREKKLADKQHNRKKSRASKAARRINR